MSNTFDSDEYDDTDDGQEQEADERFARIPRKEVRRLEAKAKAGEEAATKLAAMERRLAFSEAGVDPNHPAAVYFAKAYDGDITPEAVREKWAEIAGASGGAQQQADAELAQMQQASQLVSSGIADIPTNRLAERDAKLKELLKGQPTMNKEREFNEILEQYGTTMAP